jgi:hypothetical protein
VNETTVYDRVNRLRLKLNLRTTDIAWLTRDEEGNPLTPNIMGTWSSRGTLTRSLPLLSDTFFWSHDYLYGNSNELFRGDLLAAREKLREWARTNDMSHMNIADRFVAVWQKWSELLPMREEIWAIYCKFHETVAGDIDNPIHYDNWNMCKHRDYEGGKNTFTPERTEIDGAVWLTGLPLRWWYTGNSILLRKFTAHEVERLEAIILGNGIDPLDVEAMVNSELVTK